MRVATFAERLDFFKRHCFLAAPYLTTRKLANLVLNEMEFQLGGLRLKSFPPFIKLESTPLCHMACPGCAHSSKEFKKSLGNAKHLSLGAVQSTIEDIGKYLIGTSLSYTGEPLLNKQLLVIVSFLHSRGIYTSFPTNLSVPISPELAETIVMSGLDLMMVSLDGATSETYGAFRVGGNFNLVRSNVRLIADTKKRLGRKRPYMLWKFIKFPHNIHETKFAKINAKDWGFDGIEFDLDHDSDVGIKKQALASTITKFDSKSPKRCYWAWNTSTITWDGDVQPCCKQMNLLSMGNVSQGFSTVWNSESYRELRASFSKRPKDLNDTCRKCMGFSN